MPTPRMGILLKTWIRLAPASPMAQGRLDDLVTRNMIKFVVDEMDVSGYAYVPKKEQAREEQVREEHARKGEARKGKPLTLGRRDWSREVPMATLTARPRQAPLCPDDERQDAASLRPRGVH